MFGWCFINSCFKISFFERVVLVVVGLGVVVIVVVVVVVVVGEYVVVVVVGEYVVEGVLVVVGYGVVGC